MNGITYKVYHGIIESRRKRAIYSALALISVCAEVLFSFMSAYFIALGSYELSSIATLSVTVVVTTDTGFRLRERAAFYHSSFLGLTHIYDRLIRESTGMQPHPYLDEFEAIQNSAPNDLIASTSEFCLSTLPPIPPENIEQVLQTIPI